MAPLQRIDRTWDHVGFGLELSELKMEAMEHLELNAEILCGRIVTVTNYLLVISRKEKLQTIFAAHLPV